MSTTTTKMTLSDAERLAAAVVDALRPYVDRVEVAGSIRRRAPVVGDVEIVAIPKPGGLFDGCGIGGKGGGVEPPIDAALRQWQSQGRIALEQNGPKKKRFVAVKAGGVVELWLTSAEGWGVDLAIRTGPAEFSKALVTRTCFGGYLPINMLVRDLRVWKFQADQAPEGQPVPEGLRWFEEMDDKAPRTGYYAAVPTPEETDFLKLTVGRWIDPHRRKG